MEQIDFLKIISKFKMTGFIQRQKAPFNWDDLVIPDFLKEGLDDFIFEARNRKRFWERKTVSNIISKNNGLIALLTGPPGTGKTMTAQVIAVELGIDLYRIDLSSLTSKHLDETSQNFGKFLSQAAHFNVILFFDEADALFGKRSVVDNAHNRFADISTNHILDKIEDYNGIALLSSNKKENIDTAFIRRIRFVLEFPKPKPELRKQIWRNLFAKQRIKKGFKEQESIISILGQRVDFTGGQIHDSVLTASSIAKHQKKPLSFNHLLKGVEQELEKEGRILNTKDRKNLIRFAERK